MTSLSARLTTSRTFCTASPILCHGWSRPQPCRHARDVNTVSGVRCGMPGWHQAAVRWLNKPRTSRVPTLVLCAHDANKDALPLNERVPRRTGAPSLSADFLVQAAQSRFQWPATCLTACARPNQHPSAGLDCVRAHVARALPALHSPRVHNGSFLHCCTRERTRARADPTTPRNITRCPLAQALIERSSVRRCTAHAPRMLC